MTTVSRKGPRGKRAKPRAKRPESSLREASRGAQRRLVLDAAARILVEEGVAELNMRRLGAAVGASSTIVYTLFGGRDELLLAIFDDALDKMGAEFEKIAAPDPFMRLVGAAVAYRRFALANPHFLHVVGAPPGPLSKIVASRMRDSKPYRILLGIVQECMEAGVIARDHPKDFADISWSSVHGFVSLEVAGYFPDAAAAEESFWKMGRTILGALRIKK